MYICMYTIDIRMYKILLTSMYVDVRVYSYGHVCVPGSGWLSPHILPQPAVRLRRSKSSATGSLPLATPRSGPRRGGRQSLGWGAGGHQVQGT